MLLRSKHTSRARGSEDPLRGQMSEVLCRRQPTQSLEGQRVATACSRGANAQMELEVPEVH